MFGLRKLRKSKAAITLVEILVATFILTVGVVGALKFYVMAISATEYARDLTVATTHGEYVLEEMRARATLANIATSNWVAWTTQTGLNTLPNESITITFANTASDPLDIETTVAWVRKDRVGNVVLRTELTK